MRISPAARIVVAGALALAAAGCCSRQKTVPLYDPESGQKIGVKNLTTREYVLATGWRLPESELKSVRVAPADAKPEIVEAKARLDAITRGAPVQKAAKANWSNGSCWLMSEGGVGCFGCCGGDRCFENCWDYQ